MIRAVGFCKSEECEEAHKGVFLINHGREFFCPNCKSRGQIVQEEGYIKGTSNKFREVRIEFKYDSKEERYRGLAIVKDSVLGEEHSVYYFKSALISVSARALKVAEVMISNLNLNGRASLAKDQIVSLQTPMIDMSVSKEDFCKRLNELSESWNNLKEE